MSYCPNVIHIIFKCRSKCCDDYDNCHKSASDGEVPSRRRSCRTSGLIGQHIDLHKSLNIKYPLIMPGLLTEQYQYLMDIYNKGEQVNLTTITIGGPGGARLNRMSHQDKYRYFKKVLKSYFYTNTGMYIYEFEEGANGVFHLHGLEARTYPSNFHNYFKQFGSRNDHKDSCQKINKINSFFYTRKERIYPPITNITKASYVQYKRALKTGTVFSGGAPGTGDERGCDKITVNSDINVHSMALDFGI